MLHIIIIARILGTFGQGLYTTNFYTEEKICMRCLKLKVFCFSLRENKKTRNRQIMKDGDKIESRQVGCITWENRMA